MDADAAGSLAALPVEVHALRLRVAEALARPTPAHRDIASAGGTSVRSMTPV